MRQVTGLVAVVAWGLAACGADPMSADTSCRQFLQAPADERDAAVARVSDEVGAQMAVTPLGRPNIEFLCSQDQDGTLGDAVRNTG